MNLLQSYLRDLRSIYSSHAAVKETSYYGALEKLFNEVGKSLKPKVRCIINIKSKGAGIPDGGLFTADQLQDASSEGLIEGQLPSRGCIEIKGTGEKIETTVKSAQVKKYLSRYGQVLVTNYRDFALVAMGQDGMPVTLETYHIAESEDEFWRNNVNELSKEQGERFIEYIKRMMLHAAPLEFPEDVAWFLASYARDARARIEKSELPALKQLRSALEEALGIKFTGKNGEHFFRSTLIQTLFYGVFSAWVLWSKQHSPSDTKARFEWQSSVWSLRVPMIKALFEQLATPSKLKPLGLMEVLDWTATALNRVKRTAFFDKFEESDAVQYFYEPFLEAFDPLLRKQLGVWYTPPEIVKYMVARVDTVLREELNLPDGLADRNVFVLDPCCGTGAYLVEVIRKIGETLREQGGDTLLSYDLKKAAMERIFGFEILPAPFVVAHLQLGLLLQQLGAPLSEEKEERAAVYLTNALTGWAPPEGPKKQLALPELEEERDAAERVKCETPILVILGNPPYNAFAGISPAEEQGLVEPYKEGLISEWGIKKFNLDDLYIRFFRLAERRIAEQTRKGVVSFISNHSWVSDPSFVVLRKHLLETFDSFWIENMHGNRKISEYAPDGKTSETIFAIPRFSVGIQQGVAISLWVKGTNKKRNHPRVLFRNDIDAAKAVKRKEQLLESLNTKDFDAQYKPANPEKLNRFSFRPSQVAAHYREWPRTIDLCLESPSNGLMEKRRGALIDIDKASLEKRMVMYYNIDIKWEALQSLETGLTRDAARFDAKATRQKVTSIESYNPSNLRRYAVRPFDTQWCYYSPVRPLWNEVRPTLWAQCWEGNSFLLTRFKRAKDPEGPPFYFTHCLSDDHLLTPDAVAIPLRLRTFEKKKIDLRQKEMFAPVETETNSTKANLSETARAYLATLKITDFDQNFDNGALLWFHVLAVGYSPLYLSENDDGIGEDWPRIPLPAERDVLIQSAKLGLRLAGLLDTENRVPEITAGKIRRELRLISSISKEGKGSPNPDEDFQLLVNWGYAGREGVTMPGQGKVFERDYTEDELAAFEEGTTQLGMSIEEVLAILGTTTCDVYLNENTYWRNIPLQVWDYTIGGSQVIKKWLSYRDYKLFGRSLTLDEVREVTSIARRIVAILLLQPALNVNYGLVKQQSFAWSSVGTKS